MAECTVCLAVSADDVFRLVTSDGDQLMAFVPTGSPILLADAS